MKMCSERSRPDFLRHGILALALTSFCALAPPAFSPTYGQEKEAQSEDSSQTPRAIERTKPVTISVAQEKSILAFVSVHDQSLHGLLGNLRSSRPQEYQKALVDLLRVTERLAQIKRNRPHAYDLEVKKWQAQSKVQLLAARLAMSPDPQTRAELRSAIEERADLELQVLQADREVIAKRLKLLEEQIALSEASKASRIQQQFDRTLAASRRARAAKSSASPKNRSGSADGVPTRLDQRNSDSSSKERLHQEPSKSHTPKNDASNKSSKREGASS